MKQKFVLTAFILLGLTLIILLFGDGQASKDCTTMSKENRNLISNAILTRDFAGWNGFPESCIPNVLINDFPIDLSGKPDRPLGELHEPAVFVVLDMEGYYRPTVNIRDKKIVLFDGMNPELVGGLKRLKDELGDPAARLDWFYGTLEIPNGEWVYPERGITLFLNTLADKALYIAVYHSTNLNNYLKTLRPNYRKELEPLQQFEHE